MAKPPTKLTAGRPSDYTDELSQHICDLLIEGKSLRQICEADDMPHRRTVLRWLEAHGEFATRYARARESQGDLMDDKILETAEASTPATAAADRVKIDAYKWRASKLVPKRYGEAVQMKHSGAIGHFDPTRHTSDELRTILTVLEPAALSGPDGGGDQGGTGEA